MAVDSRYRNNPPPEMEPLIEQPQNNTEATIIEFPKRKQPKSELPKKERKALESIQKQEAKAERNKKRLEQSRSDRGLESAEVFEEPKNTEYTEIPTKIDPTPIPEEKIVDAPTNVEVTLELPKKELSKLFTLCAKAEYLEKAIKTCHDRILNIENTALPAAKARQEKDPKDRNLRETVLKISFEKVKAAEQALEYSKQLLPLKSEIFQISKLSYSKAKEWYTQEKSRRENTSIEETTVQETSETSRETALYKKTYGVTQDKEILETSFDKNSERIQEINKRLLELKPLLEQIKIGWFSKVKVDANGFITNLPEHSIELLINEIEQKIEKLRIKGKTDEANQLKAKIDYLNEHQDLLAERAKLAAMTGTYSDSITLETTKKIGSMTVGGTSIIYKK